MMKKLGASFLEVVQMAAFAILLVFTAWIATIPGPVRAWKGSGLASTRAETVAGELQQYLMARGPWIAAIGLAAILGAGFLRNEKAKMWGLVRVVAAGAALMFAFWAAADLKEYRLPTAWNCLFVATGATVVCTALMIGGKGGGGGGEPKPAK